MSYKQMRVNYIHLRTPTLQMFDTLIMAKGIAQKDVVRLSCKSYLKLNRAFYIKAALKDAEARGISQHQHYQILREQDESQLPGYTGDRPLFGAAAIDAIAPIDPQDSVKRRFGTVNFSAYNYVCMRVALLVHLSSISGLMSRITEWHLSRHWEKAYNPQISLDNACRYTWSDSAEEIEL